MHWFLLQFSLRPRHSTHRGNLMKQPSVYLKMRVLGAIDTVAGRTRHERVHNVAAMTFLDEEGNSRRFTWRTIQTWFYRYKNHGITGMTNRSRKDKGQTRKVTPEELLEAIKAAFAASSSVGASPGRGVDVRSLAAPKPGVCGLDGPGDKPGLGA